MINQQQQQGQQQINSDHIVNQNQQQVHQQQTPITYKLSMS